MVPHHRERLNLTNMTHPLPSVVSSKLQELEGDHFEASSTLDIIKTECVPRPSQQDGNELEGTQELQLHLMNESKMMIQVKLLRGIPPNILLEISANKTC